MLGHFVYAGARKQADLDALNEIDNVQSVKLDVTVQEQINAAVATVNNSGRGLYGLVNNAALGTDGVLATMHNLREPILVTGPKTFI